MTEMNAMQYNNVIELKVQGANYFQFLRGSQAFLFYEFKSNLLQNHDGLYFILIVYIFHRVI